ncbi:MAG: hypothetical protein IJ844_07865 [Prevotella sp.]|nr:hypothetical protein [Prevotella sp.]
MSETIQYSIVAAILAAAVAVSIRGIAREYRRTKTAPLRCAGCPLAEGCKTKDRLAHNGYEKTTDLKKCEQIIAETKKKF